MATILHSGLVRTSKHLTGSNGRKSALYLIVITSLILANNQVFCKIEDGNLQSNPNKQLDIENIPSSQILSQRHKRQDDYDDDDDGGGGNAGFVAGATDAIGQINAQTVALVSNFLPQAFSTFSRFGQVANMALNGTDTPNISSFLVKHGQSAVKLFKSFINQPTTEDPYHISPLSLREWDTVANGGGGGGGGGGSGIADPIPIPQNQPLYSFPVAQEVPKRSEEDIMRELQQLQYDLDNIKKSMNMLQRNEEITRRPVIQILPPMHTTKTPPPPVPMPMDMKSSFSFLMKMLSQMESITVAPTGPSLWTLYSNLADRKSFFPISSAANNSPTSPPKRMWNLPNKTKPTKTPNGTTPPKRKESVTSLSPLGADSVSKSKPVYWMNKYYPNGIRINATRVEMAAVNNNKPQLKEPMMRISPKLRGFPTRFPPRHKKLGSSFFF